MTKGLNKKYWHNCFLCLDAWPVRLCRVAFVGFYSIHTTTGSKDDRLLGIVGDRRRRGYLAYRLPQRGKRIATKSGECANRYSRYVRFYRNVYNGHVIPIRTKWRDCGAYAGRHSECHPCFVRSNRTEPNKRLRFSCDQSGEHAEDARRLGT